MDIRYAILAFLDWKDFSGYDLKKIISRSELFYWSGNNNQIYTALTQLHKEGLVSQQVEVQESLPARKIYSITAEGRGEFQRWLASAPDLPEIHHHFLIQLAWADRLSDADLEILLARYEDEIVVQLKMRQEESARGIDRPERTPREKFLWRKIDENLIDKYQSELDWVRDLRAKIHASDYQSGY
jgi:DNA-binding PadR family transcriptional regulator